MESSKNKSNTLTIIMLVLLVILAALLVFGFFFNRSKIDELTKSLQETKEQVANVEDKTQEGKQNIAETTIDSAKDIAAAIKDVNNPKARLALTKAYAERLKTLLTPAEQDDLDTIIVYLDKNPKTLFTKNPTYPDDVKQALAKLKAKLANAKNNSVATMQAIDEATYTQGETITITGPITYIAEDETLGGSIFTVTDSETGYTYFLHLNSANSQNVQDSMLDEDVTVQIKVTSKTGDPLTFQVTSGPTLASDKTEPTQTPTP